MSVALLMGPRGVAIDNEQNVYIPVAGDQSFEGYWRPVAVELGLKWILWLSTGTSLPREHVAELIDELERLRVQLAQMKPVRVIARILPRVAAVIRALNEFQRHPDWQLQIL
jgi:hypothetical protein